MAAGLALIIRGVLGFEQAMRDWYVLPINEESGELEEPVRLYGGDLNNRFLRGVQQMRMAGWLRPSLACRRTSTSSHRSLRTSASWRPAFASNPGGPASRALPHGAKASSRLPALRGLCRSSIPARPSRLPPPTRRRAEGGSYDVGNRIHTPTSSLTGAQSKIQKRNGLSGDHLVTS